MQQRMASLEVDLEMWNEQDSHNTGNTSVRPLSAQEGHYEKSDGDIISINSDARTGSEH